MFGEVQGWVIGLKWKELWEATGRENHFFTNNKHDDSNNNNNNNNNNGNYSAVLHAIHYYRKPELNTN
jgi:hypothetical protein